jgi:hypothetical protein
MSAARDQLDRMRELSEKAGLIVDGMHCDIDDKDIPDDVKDAIEASSRRLEAAHKRMLNQVYGYGRVDQPHRS